MHRDRLLNVAVVLLACAAVVSTSFALRKHLTPRAAPVVSLEPVWVEGWERYQDPGSRIGPQTAAVTVVEFSDFQCVYCKRHALHLDRLRAKYGDDLAIVFRHFPITERHPHAYAAAHAAECAREQGRFEENRAVLFNKQEAIGKVDWGDLAAEAGVGDLNGFRRCMEEHRHAARIEQDLAAGRELGTPATPTSLINGWKVLGALDEEKLDAMIAEALGSR
jgi:protein-disulfide isomerase